MTRLLGFTRHFFRSTFTRHVGVLVGGTALGQGIAILASPLITRLYTPSDFGVLTLFTALLSILLTLVSGRYEIAIPLAKDDAEARHLRALSITLVLCSGVIVGLTIPLYGSSLTTLTNTPQLLNYLWLLPISLSASGLYQVLHFWATREERFNTIARTKMMQILGQIGSQLAFGILYTGPLGLLLGSVLGRTVGSGTLLKAGRPHLSDWKLAGLQSAARNYIRFPLYTSWGSFINTVGTQSAPFLLSAFFSTEVTGFFGLTTRILALPTLLVGQAVNQVFYPQAAKLKGDALRTLVERTASILLLGSIPIFTTIIFLGPELFAWVFGAQWLTSGVYAQYIALWLLVSFVSAPLSSLTLIFERNRAALVVTVIETAARIGGLWLGGLQGSAQLAIGLYAVAGLVITSSYLGWVLALAGTNLLGWLASLKSYLGVAVLVIGLVYSYRFWLPVTAGFWLTLSTLALLAGWLWATYYVKNLR